MFVVPKKTEKTIDILDNYVSLKNINDNGDLEFDITYRINKLIVIKNNITKVKIVCYINEDVSQQIDLASPPVVMNTSTKGVTAQSMIRNILFMQQQYIQHTKRYKENIITEVISDVTTSISNDSIKKLRKGISDSINEKTLVKVDKNVNKPNHVTIFPKNMSVEKETLSLREYLLNLMIKENFDPSDLVLTDNNNYISARKNISGLILDVKSATVRGKYWKEHESEQNNKTSAISSIIPTRDYNVSNTSQISENDYVVAIEQKNVDYVDITCRVVIRKDDINKFTFTSLEKLKIKFSVLNTKMLSIDDIEKEINIHEFYKRFITPKIAPIVNFHNYESNNKAVLQVKQKDKTANNVAIYQKKISISKVGNIYEPYIFTGVYRLKKDEISNIPVQISENFINIIRVIPIYSEGFDTESYFGNDFTNVVVSHKQKNKEFNNVSIVSKITAGGILIEIRDIPVNVVAFYVKRRNLTIFEKEYSNVGTDLFYIDRTRKQGVYVVNDNDVKDGYIYEYSCELIYKDGKKENTGLSYIEYIPLVKNLVSTKIENLKTSTNENNMDVSFQIVTHKIDSHTESVEKMMKRDEKDKFYINELSQNKESLNELMAWKISRINLSEGIREEIGVVTDPNFVESKYRNINSLTPLKNGHSYRYEINTLKRNAATMFPTNKITYVNPVTLLKHDYYPYKFLHPITLKYGNTVSQDTIKAHYPKEEMEFGRIGDIEYIDVSFETSFSNTIEKILVEKFDKEYVYVSWEYKDNIKDVDFFLILLEENEQKRMIGKVQANSNKSRHQFIHVLEPNQLGNYYYIIIPFMNNYTMGKEHKSNSILVK